MTAAAAAPSVDALHTVKPAAAVADRSRSGHEAKEGVRERSLQLGREEAESGFRAERRESVE